MPFLVIQTINVKTGERCESKAMELKTLIRVESF